MANGRAHCSRLYQCFHLEMVLLSTAPFSLSETPNEEPETMNEPLWCRTNTTLIIFIVWDMHKAKQFKGCQAYALATRGRDDAGLERGTRCHATTAHFVNAGRPPTVLAMILRLCDRPWAEDTCAQDIVAVRQQILDLGQYILQPIGVCVGFSIE